MLLPLFIAFTELKRYLADRVALAFSLALPIVMFALMYGAFGGEPSFSATANFVDLDNGPLSRELLDRVGAVEGMDVRLYDSNEADQALGRSRILTAFVIPAGFSRDLESGKPVSISMRRRGHGGGEGQIAAAIVAASAQEIAGGLQTRASAAAALGGGVSMERIEAAVEKLGGGGPPVVVVERGGEESGNVLFGMVAGVLTMFLMFAVTLNAQSMVIERLNGTLERLMTTRLSVNQLFAGKFLAATARAALQALILLSLAVAVMRIAGPIEFIQAVVFSLLFAAAVSSIGLVLAGFARTRDQATWGAVFLTMGMTIFSGAFVPFESGPMEVISRFTLNRPAMDALHSILSGSGGLADQWLQAAILAAVTLVGLAAARALFRTT